MRRLILLATVATLAIAKPGTYREKEDFQYSRSSTDEGSKSGFYGAQRGNMGGNYERAHNMDGLAQHQMSGLVRQVEGELGEGSKTRTGSVFTAANSRGIYGSGHYDLSNLQGRNFQEGVTYGDSQQQSSMTAESGYNAHSSAANSAAYSSSHSQSSRLQNGYNGYQYLGHNGVQSNLQQAENLQTANQYDYGGQAASGYYSQSAYDSQNAYDHTRSNVQSANSYGSNGHRKIFTAIPVKVVLRPGATVAVPIATQTYDSAHSAAYDQNSVSSSNSINQNAEAELLSNQHQFNGYRPAGPKHYESSYSYRKEWEKHDTKPFTDLPIVVPATEAVPKNSELYEDAQSLTTGQQYESTGVGSQSSQHSQSRKYYGGYNTNVNSASSSQSRQHAAYNNQHYSSASSSDTAASSQGNYNSGVGVDSTNQIEDVNSKPKSYHSSYSYHKSWERQGDPYVIKPASSGYDAQASQRLTAASTNQGAWTSRHYGSQQSHQNVLNLEDCDCDEYGHARVARSYNSNQFEEQNSYQPDQQFLSQQSQNLEDLSQQTQSQWDKLVETEQQTQSQWDKLEDVGQQSQAQWGKLEDLGQQTENKFDKIEDLGQQTQNKFDKIEDLGQQVQNPFDKLEDLGQQAQNSFDKLEDLGQQTQNQFDKIEDLGQQTQSQWNQFEDGGQQTQSKWDNFDGQHTQLDGQQLQNTWNQMEIGNSAGVGQETQTNWDNTNIQQQDKSIEGFTPKSDVAGLSGQNNNNKPGIPPENIPGVFRNPWDQLSNNNNPAPVYNNLNHPWLNNPRSSEQTPNGYYNQRTYNSWSNHESSFSDSTRSNWHNSYFNTRPTATMPQNTAQDSSTLWNLWNKVDTIEKQTISSKNDTSTVPDNSFNNPYPWLDTGIIGASSTSTPRQEETSTVTPTTKKDKPVLDEKSNPSNVGRGDIGPEDITPEINAESDETKPKPDEFIPTVEHKPYKTLAEIEALSQVIDNGKTNSNVNHIAETENSTVNGDTSNANLDLHHKNNQWPYYFQQNENKEKSISTQNTEGVYQNTGSYNGSITTIETGRNNNDHMIYGQQSLNQYEQGNENLEQQNLHSQFEIFGQSGVFSSMQNTNISKEDVSTESVITTIQETQYLQGTNSYTAPVIHGLNFFRPRPNNETVRKLEQNTLSSVFVGNDNVVKNLDNVTLPDHVDENLEPSNNGKSPSTNNIYNDHWFNHMSHPAPDNQEIQTNNFYNQKPDMDNFQQYEHFGDQNNMFYQQNSQQELESFQQQSNNSDQQNTDQQFDSFDLQNGKENMNMEQQFETFTQQITAPTTNDTVPNFDITVQKPDHAYNIESIHTNQKSSTDQQTEQKYENFSPEAPVEQVFYTGNERNTYNSYNKFEHSTERFDQTNWNQVEDLTQQIQNNQQSYANEKQDVQETQNLEVIPVYNREFEAILKQDRAPKLQSTINMDTTTLSITTVGTLPEAETEKPGFWKSVGSKFVSAKDKVVSWFSTG